MSELRLTEEEMLRGWAETEGREEFGRWVESAVLRKVAEAMNEERKIDHRFLHNERRLTVDEWMDKIRTAAEGARQVSGDKPDSEQETPTAYRCAKEAKISCLTSPKTESRLLVN